MASSEQEHYLLDKRDESEIKRLNFQHQTVIKQRGNHILDPSIPKQNLKSIADVATGTGIWLEDVATELAEAGNNMNDVELIGFDISSDQFPKNPTANIDLVLSDINQGFPEKYHARFDVVHVQFVVVVLQLEQISNAVENIMMLLKPGGYLQWTDFDFTLQSSVYPSSAAKPLHELSKLVLNFYKSQNWSLNILGEVRPLLEGYRVRDVKVENHVSVREGDPGLQRSVVEWQKQTIEGVIGRVWARSGKTEGEVGRLVVEYKGMVDDLVERGEVFSLMTATLMARKVS